MAKKEKFTLVVKVYRKKGKYSFFVKTPYDSFRDAISNSDPQVNVDFCKKMIEPCLQDLYDFIRREAL